MEGILYINRYIVECKGEWLIWLYGMGNDINRYIVECKVFLYKNLSFPLSYINRYIVECKETKDYKNRIRARY